MIDVSVLSIFIMTSLILAISPGPDLLLITSYASSKGVYSGFAISVGVFVSGLLQTLLVAFGLVTLLQVFPLVAFLIKLVGAAYLLWLGAQLIMSWYKRIRQPQSLVKSADKTNKQLFLLGMLNNLLNPKALLFFSLFLPQFVNTEHPIFIQTLLLGGLLSCIALAVNMMASWVFSIAAKQFAGRVNIGEHLNGLLGVLFVGLAFRVATTE